jgi:rhodanese-related sulfurtransferase/DNA-binding transcriptional ArsR family regulator
MKMHFKLAVYEQLARCTRALASPQRLELLDVLAQAPRTVEALAREAGLTVANTSRHLQVLRAAHLVESQRSGVFITYRLPDEQVKSALRHLRILAESRLAEIDRIKREFLGEPLGFEEVDRETLLQRVRQDSAVVLDVRPVEEYRSAHIAGAISIPLKELAQRLSELPPNQEIVAYCRGPYCVLAIQAVELLRSRGYRASRLEDGVWDWQAMGYPVASS